MYDGKRDICAVDAAVCVMGVGYMWACGVDVGVCVMGCGVDAGVCVMGSGVYASVHMMGCGVYVWLMQVCLMWGGCLCVLLEVGYKICWVDAVVCDGEWGVFAVDASLCVMGSEVYVGWMLVCV